MTKVGDDVFGREARATLLAEGLPEWGILSGRAPTGVAFILVDAAAENMIAIAPGANLELTTHDVLGLGKEAHSANIVLVQLECAAALATGIAAWARASGKRAILNPAPARDLTVKELSDFDIITPNETELFSLATCNGIPGGEPAEQAAALVRAGVSNVVVTMGRNGALWVNAEGISPPTRPGGRYDRCRGRVQCRPRCRAGERRAA